MSNPSNMKAIVMHGPGGPDVLKVEQRPFPLAQKGQVRIKVEAFGLNRSEMFTRQGHSPGINFPRVLGIEAVGTVDDAPGGEFQRGNVVATCMGGMGRMFDGGYAEYTVVPAAQVQSIDRGTIGWDVIGAMPEMLQTSYGSLFFALQLSKGERLLIRGGTTSIGLAAASLAKAHGAFVVSTSRQPKDSPAAETMRKAGVDDVLVDDGKLSDQIQSEDAKFDKVLELIGTNTLKDSLRCCKAGGTTCMTGIAGGSWTLKEVNPMELIPSGVRLTVYSGGPAEFMKTPLSDMVKLVEEGKLKMPIGRVFKMDDIVEAHTLMEESKASGKIVVLTS